MGCCPSKSRAERDACSDTSTAKEDATGIAALRESIEATHSSSTPASPSNNETPSVLLLDRGDGTMVPKSDESTPSSPQAVGPVPNKGTDAPAGGGGGDAERDVRDAEPTSATSAARPLSSPRKVALNYEDMPINSMYHRIHIVEAEEQDAKRQEALRSEAERHEREVREFKASMLAT